MAKPELLVSGKTNLASTFSAVVLFLALSFKASLPHQRRSKRFKTIAVKGET